jgi:hypothetical protein
MTVVPEKVEILFILAAVVDIKIVEVILTATSVGMNVYA